MYLAKFFFDKLTRFWKFGFANLSSFSPFGFKGYSLSPSLANLWKFRLAIAFGKFLGRLENQNFQKKCQLASLHSVVKNGPTVDVKTGSWELTPLWFQHLTRTLTLPRRENVGKNADWKKNQSNATKTIVIPNKSNLLVRILYAKHILTLDQYQARRCPIRLKTID